MRSGETYGSRRCTRPGFFLVLLTFPSLSLLAFSFSLRPSPSPPSFLSLYPHSLSFLTPRRAPERMLSSQQRARRRAGAMAQTLDTYADGVLKRYEQDAVAMMWRHVCVALPYTRPGTAGGSRARGHRVPHLHAVVISDRDGVVLVKGEADPRIESVTWSLPSSEPPFPSSVFRLPSPLFPLPSSLAPLPSSLFSRPSSLFPLLSPLFPLPSSVAPLPSSLGPHPLPLFPLLSPLAPPTVIPRAATDPTLPPKALEPALAAAFASASDQVRVPPPSNVAPSLSSSQGC